MPKGMYIRTKEIRKKLSKALKGRKPWITGKKVTKAMKEKYKNSFWDSGKKSCHWKGGRHKNTMGYIVVYAPNHPCVQKSNFRYILEHRLVMEKKIGKYLKDTEIVHHLNGIKDDNREENLALCNRRDHHIFIKKLQERIYFLENK